MMGLINECAKRCDERKYVSKIRVTRSVQERENSISVNSALQHANGRWIAFLNVGDVWDPTKLEKHIPFMEKNGYTFSYTKFGLINNESKE